MFKRAGDAELALHLFHPAAAPGAGPRPGIVFFFGGGWVSGTPGQFFPQCRHLSGRGLLAVAAEYRVASRHGTPPRACVADGRSAVRWLRARAGELGLDPDRLAAGGGSAGGHVAAAAAVAPAAFDDPADDLAVSCRPDALALFNPVLDNGPGGFGHDRVRDDFPGISPLHNLRPGLPPAVIFLGDQDHHFPPATAERYRAISLGHGNRCDLHVFPGVGHGFFNWGRSREHYARTLRILDEFLQSLGWVDGPTGEPDVRDGPP